MMAKTSRRPKLKEIKDLATIRALTEPTRLAIMEGLGEGRSVTELADRLELPRTRLYHHIKVLEEHDLIRVIATRKVGAIEEKIYQSSAKSFKLAPAVTSHDDLIDEAEAIGAVVFDTTKADLHRSIVKGFHEVGEEFRNRVGIGRHLGHLTHENASAMMDEIRDLIEKYMDDDEAADEHPYAFVWALYPSSATLS